MKHTSLYLCTVVFLLWSGSCQSPAGDEVNTSDIEQMDLASLKSLLAEKKSEVSQTQEEIDAIQSKMEELDPTMNNEKAQRVTVLPIQDTTFKDYITVQGLLEADETVNVNAETGGRLVQLKIEEGDYIKKGDLVGVLDLEQLSKQKAELEKSYELAEEVYERQKRLWDQNIGSEMQYLQAKNEKERLEKSLETLEFQQSQGQIHAPISGLVDVVNIKEGELVSPGAPIAVILDVRQLIATADVSENYLGDVRPGDEVIVRFPSLDLETNGRISLIVSKIDVANRTFKIEVRVNRVSKNLKPNMLTEIKINTETIEDVVTVPINLIQQEINGKEYVMVVDRSNGTPTARKVYIKRGAANDDHVVITEGLSTGDQVIRIGGRNLSEGTSLEVIDNSVLTSDSNQQVNG